MIVIIMSRDKKKQVFKLMAGVQSDPEIMKALDRLIKLTTS